MTVLRPSLPRLAQAPASTTRAAIRQALAKRTAAPPFSIIPTCPSPTCDCAQMPAGLDIDKAATLNGTVPAYSQHVLISSGQSDWKSKIEDERDTAPWGKFTADLKTAFGRGGQFHDPYTNVVISTSSFTNTARSTESSACVEALVFPSFQRIQTVPNKDGSTSDFVKSFLSSNTNAAANSGTQASLLHERISSPTILICSHSSRDSRCGVLGPLLHAEFARALSTAQPTKAEFNPQFPTFNSESESKSIAVAGGARHNVNLGTISHVGGHKWAGNVIIYVPPSYRPGTGPVNPLSGMGIWYGRVEPKHVEGIIQETLVNGRVIKDLFRGGINNKGSPLRL